MAFLEKQISNLNEGLSMELAFATRELDIKKIRLRELIKDKACLRRHANEEPFRLASGGTSSEYFDIKMVTQDPEGIALIAEILYNMIKDQDDISSIGGLESSAIAIATATSQLSYYKGRRIPAFWVRKEIKPHGTMRRIEGYLPKESKAIIIDDVTTKGSSVQLAVDGVRKEGCEVKEIITVVDREDGAVEKFREMGIKFRMIFKKSDGDLTEPHLK